MLKRRQIKKFRNLMFENAYGRATTLIFFGFYDSSSTQIIIEEKTNLVGNNEPRHIINEAMMLLKRYIKNTL
jgi:hypothetical protein